MPTFLTTTPHYDDVTCYLQNWTEEIIQEAKNRSIRSFNLEETNATREKLHKLVEAQKPGFILLNGHGNQTCIAGHGKITRGAEGNMQSDELILEMGQNEKDTKDAIIYARACSSSAKLGKSCVETGGAKAYIGYKAPFIFAADTNNASKPENDKISNYFKEITNIIAITILKGKTAEEAVARSKMATVKIIERLETSEYNTLEAQGVLPYLYLDLSILDLQGNSAATI